MQEEKCTFFHHGAHTAENKPLRVSPETHRRLKTRASERGKKLNELAETILSAYLEGKLRLPEKSESVESHYPTGHEEFALLRNILESGDAALVEAVRANLREFVRLLQAHGKLAEAEQRLAELERRVAGDPSTTGSGKGETGRHKKTRAS